MNLDYLPRAGLIALASFFLAQTLLNALGAWVSGYWLRQARSTLPGRATNRLLLARLSPLLGSLMLVGIFCLPGFLRWEPLRREHTSWFCLLLAAAGAAWIFFPLMRAGRAYTKTRRLLRQIQREGVAVALPGETRPACRIATRIPILALAGGWRPRLLISQNVMAALNTEELAAAVGHENAHRRAHDNAKRLLLLLLPPAWPGGRAARAVEREWMRLAEWAADDQAAGRDRRGSLPLASALVRMAQLHRSAAGNVGTNAPAAWPGLCLSFLGHGNDRGSGNAADLDSPLEVRVERLLQAPPMREPSSRASWPALAGIALATIAIWIFYTPLLYSFHALLEALVR